MKRLQRVEPGQRRLYARRTFADRLPAFSGQPHVPPELRPGVAAKASQNSLHTAFRQVASVSCELRPAGAKKRSERLLKRLAGMRHKKLIEFALLRKPAQHRRPKDAI